MKTVVGMFEDMGEARQAALELEQAGIAHNNISFVANNEGGRYVAADTDTAADTGTAAGPVTIPTVTVGPPTPGQIIGNDAKVGAEVGGVTGLLIGLTGFTIPGIGWIAGAGWLLGLLLGAGTGAVIGGLIGALASVGVPEEDAAHYQEGVRRGGTLIAVKAEDAVSHRVAEILGRNGAVNVDERAAQYRQEGFVPSAATAATAPTTSPTTAATMPRTGTRSASAANAAEPEAVTPVVEEEFAVDKRTAQRGGVRVYTPVIERPVEER